MLIKTVIPDFALKQELSIDGTKDNMGTISVPSRTLCPTVEIANGDFLLFDRKRLGPKELLWKQY